ncbi:MAG TPA: carbamoyltransferase HypF [Polyangiaceae bacterium]|nr:carbamoyltransferase HypF [Polyangiaceae bacterium]
MKKRWAIEVCGTVQGVGFRPYTARHAQALGLSGYVCNSGGGVRIEAQGDVELLEMFRQRLLRIPSPARIRSLEHWEIQAEPCSEGGFAITRSRQTTEAGGPSQPGLPPDLMVCADCLRELVDPEDRRYGHPFISCVACGPRYSVALGVPYDRAKTTLASFPLCPACEREYRDSTQRRYHAETIACPHCGPQLEYRTRADSVPVIGNLALGAAIECLRRGEILALRGLGGFQLLVDARSSRAVQRLRERKQREEKPLAVLFPSLFSAEQHCELTPADRRLLSSAEAPIVLVPRRTKAELAFEVAPLLDEVGALLPTTPIHFLLLQALGFPVVCTSGNPSGEPLCTRNEEAFLRLREVADGFLIHDREIARPLDDSVARAYPSETSDVCQSTPSNRANDSATAAPDLGEDRIELLRRARGYAPREVARLPAGAAMLSLGAHQKSSVALCHEGRAFLSQHLGDLDSVPSRENFRSTVRDLLAYHGAVPQTVVCDLHPDYASSLEAETLAREFQARLVRVQHHQAHVAAVLAEAGANPHDACFGLAWDGTGYGTDGTSWGSEAWLVNDGRFEHFAALDGFALTGGDRAAREPARAALGVLFACSYELAESYAARQFGARGQLLLEAQGRERMTNITRSIGRLYDAVAGLLGIRARCAYEGQSAIELEVLARRASEPSVYPLPWQPPAEGRSARGDFRPLIRQICADHARGVDPARIAAGFQESLVNFGLELARRADRETIVLSGGCFHNRFLRGELTRRLRRAGHRVLLPQRVPGNDGGIALGQLWIASLSEKSAS